MIDHLYRLNWLGEWLDFYRDLRNGPATDLCAADSGRYSQADLHRELRRRGVESWSWEFTEDKVIIFRVKLGQARRAKFVLLRLGVVVEEWTGDYETDTCHFN